MRILLIGAVLAAMAPAPLFAQTADADSRYADVGDGYDADYADDRESADMDAAQRRWDIAQERFDRERAQFERERAEFDRARQDFERRDQLASRGYDGPTWQGADGRTQCRKSDGTTGTIIGGVAGALLGRAIDGGRRSAVGTIIGGGAGALLGRGIEQNGSAACR